MTCRACDMVRHKPRPVGHVYDWQGATIEIVACFFHTGQIMKALDALQHRPCPSDAPTIR